MHFTSLRTAGLALVAATSLAGAGLAFAAGPPTATTGAATNITSSSATLNATVFPNQNSTNYSFQYGTSTAYSNQTAIQGPVNGNAGKDASADVIGLAPSTTYHFRVVATNSAGTASGADATFTTRAPGVPGPTAANAVTIGSSPTNVTFGGATTIKGQINGPGNAGVTVALEQKTFPFTGPYKPSATTTSTSTGAYSFVARPGVNTRYRVAAKTKPDVVSREMLVSVRVKVALRLSDSTPNAGQLVRFTGTVTPVHNGVIARIQRRTSTGSWKTVARTTLVQATPANGVARSKFSRRLRVMRTATYRVRVSPADGDHATGTSPRRRARTH